MRDQAGIRPGTPADEAAPAPRHRGGAAVAALAVALVVAGVARVWQVAGRPPLGWNDTVDFVASSQAPWASTGLWAGPRPPAVPVVLKLVGEAPGTYVHVQVGLAVVCWAVLAASVATVVRGRARWPAAAAVVAFSSTSPVTMWERSVLSESLALSLLALVLAAGLQVARGVTWPRVSL